MSENTYTTQSVRTYGKRVKNSFIQSIVGLILFLASFVVIFTNERISINTEKMLEHGLDNVISVSSDNIISENDGKLIHFVGKAETTEVIKDDLFPVEIKGIYLSRDVSMYQWSEQVSEKTKVKTGGNEEVITTYTYNQTWSNEQIDSSKFWNKDYKNPLMPIASYSRYVKELNVGSFALTSSFIERLSKSEDLNLSKNTTNLPDGFNYKENYFYKSENIEQPKIGDLKVNFSYVPLQTVSIIGGQQGNQIAPYSTEYGDIIIAYQGNFTAEELFTQELENNKTRTWFIRFLGFIMMFSGLRMFVGIIGTILSVLPFLQPTFTFISTPIIFMISLITSLITISLAWLFFRPLVSLGLLVVVIILWSQMRKMKRKKKEKLETELAEKNEGKLKGVNDIIEGTYTEVNEKVKETKDKITSFLNKF